MSHLWPAAAGFLLGVLCGLGWSTGHSLASRQAAGTLARHVFLVLYLMALALVLAQEVK